MPADPVTTAPSTALSSSSPPAGGPTRTLSEADSKALLAEFGVPFADERLVTSPDEARGAVAELGAPVVAKLCGEHIAHKTERGLVRLGLADADAAAAATADLLAAARPEDGATGVLIAPMLSGTRELIAGIATDPQFGRTVLLGLGGVLAEAIADVTVRLVPITKVDAEEMIEDLRSQALLGEFRGEPALDRTTVVDVLLGLSAAAESTPGLVSADLNPLIVHEGRAVAVDALVEMADGDALVEMADGDALVETTEEQR
jgi:succinyl-CoA synthetase beta subunit